jgi:hypothetical protein
MLLNKPWKIDTNKQTNTTEHKCLNTGHQHKAVQNEVLPAMDIRTTVFWDVMSFSLVQDFQHFINLHSRKYDTTFQKTIILMFIATTTSILISQIQSICTVSFSNITPGIFTNPLPSFQLSTTISNYFINHTFTVTILWRVFGPILSVC